MKIKVLLLASAFAVAGIYGASAQTQSPSTSGTDTVSAATHCKDAVSGQVKLKSAAATSSPGSSASGSAGTSPGGTTTGAAGTSPSAGAPSGSGSTAAANLPNC